MDENIIKKIVAVLLLLSIVTSVLGTFTVLQRATTPRIVMKIGPPMKANLGFSITGAASSFGGGESKNANLGFAIV